jgi:hypothetical protein
MPIGVVDTPRDEEKWEKAKRLAGKAGRKEDYAYIMGIYKKTKPSHDFKKTALFKVAQGMEPAPKFAPKPKVKQPQAPQPKLRANEKQEKTAVILKVAEEGDGGEAQTESGKGPQPRSSQPYPRFYWGKTEGKRRMCQPSEKPGRDSCRRRKG